MAKEVGKMRRVLGLLLFLLALAFAGQEPEFIKKLLKTGRYSLKEKKAIGSGLVEYVLADTTSLKFYSKKKYLVIYATEDGKYMLVGSLMDGKTAKNLTKEKYRELTRVPIKDLPLDTAIKVTYGKGGKKLIMFSDPDCPFCRKSHEWLKGKDVDLYVFLYPLKIHPGAYEKSLTILCSKDRERAYKEAMDGKEIGSLKCKEGEKTLIRHMLTGDMVGVEGTPLFIREDGYKIEGANFKELEEYLSGGQKK